MGFRPNSDGVQLPWSITEIKKNLQILGRPITLSDCFIALEQVRRLNKDSFYISSKGYLEHIDRRTGDCIAQVDWDFSKNLQEQSKEVHEFLYKLLKT